MSKDGLKPDPKKIKAITNMSTPKNKENLQRFLGMVTYLAKFILNLSQTASPLRALLEKDIEWYWSQQQEITKNKKRQKYYYDRHVKPLSKLNVGMCPCNLRASGGQLW